MELTPEEQRIIEAHRRAAEEKERNLALSFACIDALKEWKDWSLEHGESLTFSTFVNGFLGGCKHHSGFDSTPLFAGIKCMITALDALHG